MQLEHNGFQIIAELSHVIFGTSHVPTERFNSIAQFKTFETEIGLEICCKHEF